MAVLERDGAQIHYQVFGEGYPLVLFAPGGMHSVAQLWRERPGAPGQALPWFDPTAELSGDFQVVAMDQRNAGASYGPVSATDGWQTYTADHLALIDHLGFDRVHVMGGCIGSSYALALCQAVPDRVSAAVLQSPIGLSADNHGKFIDMFDAWGAEIQADHGEVTDATLDAFRHNMYDRDFVFSVSRDFVRHCPVPLLVLAGDDDFHPRPVAEEIADLAPEADLVLEWAGPARYGSTRALVRDFLVRNTPDPATGGGPVA